MINLIIIFILLIGIYSGGRRGLVVQIIHTIGYIITYVLARLFYGQLSSVLEKVIPYPSDTQASQLALYNILKNVEFDKTFYNTIAFVIIIFGGWLATRLIAASVNQLAKIPVIHQINWIGGAFLGLICNWVGLFFILSLLSVIPFGPIQNIFSGDSLATIIVKETPIFSQALFEALVTYSTK